MLRDIDREFYKFIFFAQSYRVREIVFFFCGREGFRDEFVHICWSWLFSRWRIIILCGYFVFIARFFFWGGKFVSSISRLTKPQWSKARIAKKINPAKKLDFFFLFGVYCYRAQNAILLAFTYSKVYELCLSCECNEMFFFLVWERIVWCCKSTLFRTFFNGQRKYVISIIIWNLSWIRKEIWILNLSP